MAAPRSSAMTPEINTKDPKVRAELYMASHGITELFEGLGTLLLYHRPANPREFLVQQLGEIQKAKQEQGYVRTDQSIMPASTWPAKRPVGLLVLAADAVL
jgi:hypothetical protein